MENKSDQADDSSANPYAAPASVAAPVLLEDQRPLPPPVPSAVIAKWLIVCMIAAAPSFFFGGGLGGWRFPETMGMITGILIFVAGFSSMEFLPSIRSLMRQRAKRKATRIAYITRMVISVVFPIGIFIDIYCGAISVSVSGAVTGVNGFAMGGTNYGSERPMIRFFTFLLTTLLQGTLLNIILFAYMMIVYGFLRVLGVKDSTYQGDQESTFGADSDH